MEDELHGHPLRVWLQQPCICIRTRRGPWDRLTPPQRAVGALTGPAGEAAVGTPRVVGTSGWTAGCGQAPKPQAGGPVHAGREGAVSSAPCPITAASGPLWGSSLAFCPDSQCPGTPRLTPFLNQRGFSLACCYRLCVCPWSHVCNLTASVMASGAGPPGRHALTTVEPWGWGRRVEPLGRGSAPHQETPGSPQPFLWARRQ